MFTKNFKQLSKNDADIAGGKGASLGEMTNAGIPVPSGFVVLSETFEKFLSDTDLNVEVDAILHTVDHNAMHTIEKASKNIQTLIKNAEMPKDIAEAVKKHFFELGTEFVAVRSSATAEDGAENAWAGQLDSFLNTTEENLLEKVKHCWASLFTPRAIFYRFEKNLHKQKISVAVVVQKMVESEVSGIAFSVHPVTEDYNQLIIEAGFGLGESIVSGQITPDSYVVEKDPRNILDINISTQEKGIYRMKNGGNEWVEISKNKQENQKLSRDQILELSEIVVGIEKHYGFPCDIEWALEEGKFYVVQSRPITTLAPQQNASDCIREYSELFHLDAPLAIAEITNYGETLKSVPWAREDFSFHPYCVFERKNSTLHYLYDQVGVDWKIEQAGQFDEKNITEKVLETYNKIEDIIKAEKCLEKQEFMDFLVLVKNFWVWLDGIWWMIECRDKKGLDTSSLMKTRKRTEYFMPGLIAVIRNTFKCLAPQYKKFADVLLINEVLGVDIPSKETLRARMKTFAYTDGKLFESIDEVKDIYRIEIKRSDVFAGNELEGQVAYPGKVKGIIKIIKSREDMSKFENGDIIVSSTTTPDFLPIMKISSAIISEHGGVICHASITSRELKIPCIVGVRNATQVLKDGDLVEVDAERGIIRIIKRA